MHAFAYPGSNAHLRIPRVRCDCTSLATNCATAFYLRDTRIVMNIRLSSDYQNSSFQPDKFPDIPSVKIFAEVTVTTGLSLPVTARQPMAAALGRGFKDGRGAFG